MGRPLIARGLAIGWDGVPLLGGVDLALPAGGALAIIGESGSGKSTLLATLAGRLSPLAGEVSYGAGSGAPRRAMIGQDLDLFPWKTVFENVALPLRLARAGDIPERVAAALAEMELSGLERRWPRQLSGGQRQRLALARALVVEPDIMFLDEPFSALDAILRERLQLILKRLWARHSCTIVLVTHDIGEAVFLAAEITLLGARPSRLAGHGANPSFSPDPAEDCRDSAAFYETQRRLHAALDRARAGLPAGPRGEGGAW